MLTIIRGPAGSGKSTIAKHLNGVARQNWFEADMYFERNGHYEWEASKTGQAHAWCQKMIRECLSQGKDAIVSNTTCSWEELGAYLKIASELGCEVSIIRSPRHQAKSWDARLLKERNVHNVPLKSLEKMINKYVAHPDEVEWADMSIFV